MKKALWTLWLLTKRLYKKPAFLTILLLIPVLTLCYRAAAGGESGMMTVALAQEGQDPLAQSICSELEGSSQVIRYRRCGSAQEARLLVTTGKVDAAWIFPDGMEEKLTAFLADPKGDTAVVQVLQREENVAHRLTHERLSGQVYQTLSRIMFLQYARTEFPEMDSLSDGELLKYYEDTLPEGQLFTYESVTGRALPQTHYLLAPVRGILGILAVLCGIAAAMYYRKDSRGGTFDLMPQRMRPVAELGCQIVAVGNVAAVSLVTLLLTGLCGPVLSELAVLVLYSLCVAVFSMLLRSVLGNEKLLGAMLPLTAVVSLLACPVFLDIPQLRWLSFLLPPTYYISGSQEPIYLLYMALHTLACAALYLLSEKLRKRI